MASVAGFGLDLEGIFYKAVDVIMLALTYSYDKANSFISWTINTFHYNRPMELLALSLFFCFAVILLIGVIGGTGVHGDKTAEGEGLLGLSGEGVNIGSNEAVLGVSEGLTRGKFSLTTSIAPVNITPNATTTIDLSITCDSNADCAARFPQAGGYGPGFCCPVGTGVCEGYCCDDCVVECEWICVEYDTDYNPPICEEEGCASGTEDYGACVVQCAAGGCIRSDETVYLVSPANQSTEDNATLNLDWVMG